MIYIVYEDNMLTEEIIINVRYCVGRRWKLTKSEKWPFGCVFGFGAKRRGFCFFNNVFGSI